MQDKYFVYRPLIDLIGLTEGTAPPKGRGYNETLAYGAYTGGPVELVTMTLDQVDALQLRMLRHPDNRLNSSAVGWPQIVRRTMRSIRDKLRLSGRELFDADMQDRMACYLLGVRGIDKYLAGRLREDTLIDNLAQEWASLPTTAGRGYYGGQHAAVTPAKVRTVLAEVRRRHREGQPKDVVTIEKPVVPPAVEKEVRQKTNWLSGIFGSGAIGTALAAFLQNAQWWQIVLILLTGAIVSGGSLWAGIWIVRRIKAIRDEWKAA